MKNRRLRGQWIIICVGSAGWMMLLISLALAPPLWSLFVLYSLVLVGVMIQRTATNLMWLPFGVIGSSVIIMIVQWAMRLNPDPQAQLFANQWGWIGPTLFLLGLVVAFICVHLLNNDWGRKLQGWPTVQELVLEAQDLKNPNRSAAVLGLGGYNDRRATTALNQASHDADPGVREAAALALLERSRRIRRGHEAQGIAAASESQTPAQPEQVFTPLQTRIENLLLYLGSPVGSAQHDYAFRQLQTLGVTIVPVLIQEVKNEVPAGDRMGPPGEALRPLAILMLGLLGPIATEAAPALLRLLDQERNNLRLDIIDALGRIGNQIAVPALVMYLSASDAEGRAAAAQALGNLGDPRALPALQEMYQSVAGRDAQERRLKAVAAEAIARIQRHQQ